MPTKKRGRPHIPYRRSWGENINGLTCRPDGRWRIVATGKLFSESDERLAVARYKRWLRENSADTVSLVVKHTELPDLTRNEKKDVINDAPPPSRPDAPAAITAAGTGSRFLHVRRDRQA